MYISRANSYKDTSAVNLPSCDISTEIDLKYVAKER